jgi:hypothetical protein
MLKILNVAVLTKAEFERLAGEGERGRKRLELVAHATALKREEIVAGVERGPEDPTIKSVLAIVRGLREATVAELASAQTTPDDAAVLRGKLRFESELVAMLGACWRDLERTRKAEAKKE